MPHLRAVGLINPAAWCARVITREQQGQRRQEGVRIFDVVVTA